MWYCTAFFLHGFPIVLRTEFERVNVPVYSAVKMRGLHANIQCHCMGQTGEA